MVVLNLGRITSTKGGHTHSLATSDQSPRSPLADRSLIFPFYDPGDRKLEESGVVAQYWARNSVKDSKPVTELALAQYSDLGSWAMVLGLPGSACGCMSAWVC